ncbi:hypothetical protein B0A55_01462 [Friedmanniomyces simplex]|uniref:K Homology domain-containing protein n=1 Tax=Friedmanniomyces simplex TaxID=329884 RepID=A0A4U0XZ84_9PEZI|nr:hypothetical protein B0A55_01462 [Friedmanniomyces simplex]
MADEPRKRSRFDQTEPPRKSRFDRRSRSPARGDEETGRSRSPVSMLTKGADSPGGKDVNAAAAAAAAAAKINASINAKKGIQHVDVPPIRSDQSPTAPGAAKSPSQPGGAVSDEIYTQDGDYIKDVEINDLRNRYTLTKGSTQKMIKEKTGADVTTRGNYYPDKSMATAANPPLYLHITSTTKDGLEKAVQEIDALMQQDLPNLVDERRFRRRDQEQQPPVERDHLGRRKWPEERIPIDLEPIPGFNLRAQVVGAGGSYVKHIQSETRCRVQIKGRGSGFMEHDTGRESDEPMYLHVAGPDPAEVENAKGMCISLLDSVKESYDAFKERAVEEIAEATAAVAGIVEATMSEIATARMVVAAEAEEVASTEATANTAEATAAPNHHLKPCKLLAGMAGGGAMSPNGGADQAQAMQAWAAYYAANPSADPYAAYGGYGQVMDAYMKNPGAYFQQQGQGQGQGMPQGPGHMNGTMGGPPSASPGDHGGAAPPPPPPPGASGNGGGYSQVPPPPGI